MNFGISFEHLVLRPKEGSKIFCDASMECYMAGRDAFHRVPKFSPQKEMDYFGTTWKSSLPPGYLSGIFISSSGVKGNCRAPTSALIFLICSGVTGAALLPHACRM